MRVQFEEDAYARVAPIKDSALYSFLRKLGIKRRSQANLIMFVFVVACGFVIYSFFPDEKATHPNAPHLTEEDNQRAGQPSEIGVVR